MTFESHMVPMAQSLTHPPQHQSHPSKPMQPDKINHAKLYEPHISPYIERHGQTHCKGTMGARSQQSVHHDTL